jgi:uncharacterized protein (DUF305 family)
MNTLSSRHLLAPTLLALLLAASACQQDPAPEGTAADTTTAVDDGNTAAQDLNVAFIDSMVPHHAMGVHMADMELEHGERQEVKTMARQIKDGQSQDITRMNALRHTLTGSDATATGMSMGSMSQATMDSMMAMHGTEMDQAFLQHMIRHHEDGLDMARRMQAGLTQPDLQAMVQEMMTTHEQEIAEMRRLQGQGS